MEDIPDDTRIEKSKDKGNSDANALQNALRYYSYLIKRRPLLVKSITSGVTAAISNIVSQRLVNGAGHPIDWRAVANFAGFGLVVTAPLVHHFYLFLDYFVPKTAQCAAIKKLIIDRLGFAPAFLLLFFYVMSLLEGKTSAEAVQKIKQVYWEALKMNWKVWTIVQYVNLKYVPIQYRVLVGNIVSLLWNVYLSSKNSRA